MTPYVIRTESGRIVATSDGAPSQANLAMFEVEEGEPVRCQYEPAPAAAGEPWPWNLPTWNGTDEH